MTTLQIINPGQMPAYSDSYERDKLRILQSLNVQIQNLAVKLDQIVTQTEQIYFKNSLPNNTQAAPIRHAPYPQQRIKQSKAQHINKLITSSETIQPTMNRAPPPIASVIDDGMPKSSKKLLSNNNVVKTESSVRRPPDTTAKRNKQQRQFNTFVRESINQLLGPDFMRTHDVQDIDQSVMEMIRKEAVENYLPDNIRPRRAWHLAKASLRTLKRTLNNRNPNANKSGSSNAGDSMTGDGSSSAMAGLA